MINNRVLELNIRIILNVLCLKNKLLNTGVQHDTMIHLIKKNLFPLIPSFLSFLNDMKLFEALHSFRLTVDILKTLIKNQNSYHRNIKHTSSALLQ